MRRRRVGLRPAIALPLALLLALAAAIVSPVAAPVAPFLGSLSAPVVRAADGLVVTTAARYVVVPDRSVVRVTVDATIRNDTPDKVSGGVVTRYWYDGVNLGVQPEATHLAASQDGVAVAVSSSRKTGYRLANVSFRGNLYYQESTTVRLTFDLAGGRPRSSSDVRVGKAFATFLAWAFGDSGSVRVEVPGDFSVDVSGESFQRTFDGTTTVLAATTTDPLSWYAWINATNDAGLTSQLLDIQGGEEIVVRGWPEDSAWRKRVADLLTRGVPQLVSRIGLPWPVQGALSVIEVHTPLLEGYAGFYDIAEDQITISEDLDDLTIIHEASHAWFTTSLFVERWITEGLADEYALRVLVALGDDPQGHGDVARTDAAAFPLNSWPPPAPIQDDQSAAKEQYGYDASWLVMSDIVTSAGEAGMRRVFAAAHDGTTAYVGDGPPEQAALPNDWRRFLDLTEELGGATGVADLMETWALPPGSSDVLRSRATARDAYHALLTAEHGWTTPYAVRRPLDAWQFTAARARIAEAERILGLRDASAILASDEGLTPPPDLETAFEQARDASALSSAASLAQETRTSLEAVAAADAAAAAPRDWLVSLGLDGHDPDADLATAREAWAAGDLGTAASRAALVASVLAAAPELGRTRATQIGLGIGLVLVVLLLLVLVRRRRARRRRAMALAAAASGATFMGPPAPGAAAPEGPDRYATLPPSAPPDGDPGPGPIDEEGAGTS